MYVENGTGVPTIDCVPSSLTAVYEITECPQFNSLSCKEVFFSYICGSEGGGGASAFVQIFRVLCGTPSERKRGKM